MSQAAIRTIIYNCVNGISNIGVVHDYDRFTADWTAFKARYATTISSVQVIRAWDVCFENMDPVQPMEFGKSHKFMRKQQFVIRGYWGLHDGDASEKAAAAMAETVCNALDVNTYLCNSANYYQDPGSLAKIRLYAALVFGDTLCHYTEIEISVWEIIA